MRYKEIFNEIDEIIKAELAVESKLQAIADLLQQKISYYDWVGFYFADADNKVLNLGPYAGLTTEHTQIAYGKGICGQVDMSNETFLVSDVNAQDNYISCNINVKSEIVVPIFVNNKNIGQIDIDSNTLDAFTTEDRLFLEDIAKKVGNLYI